MLCFHVFYLLFPFFINGRTNNEKHVLKNTVAHNMMYGSNIYMPKKKLMQTSLIFKHRLRFSLCASLSVLFLLHVLIHLRLELVVFFPPWHFKSNLMTQKSAFTETTTTPWRCCCLINEYIIIFDTYIKWVDFSGICSIYIISYIYIIRTGSKG